MTKISYQWEKMFIQGRPLQGHHSQSQFRFSKGGFIVDAGSSGDGGRSWWRARDEEVVGLLTTDDRGEY